MLNKMLERVRFFEVVYHNCGKSALPEYNVVLPNGKYYYRFTDCGLPVKWMMGHAFYWEIKIEKLKGGLSRGDVTIRELTTLESIIRFDEKELEWICYEAKKSLL